MAMGDNKKADVDSETILMTLDQIGQTIDIMTNVVGRLRGYITEQIEQKPEGNFGREQELVTHEGPKTLH
jgi:hypothetical protein